MSNNIAVELYRYSMIREVETTRAGGTTPTAAEIKTAFDLINAAVQSQDTTALGTTYALADYRVFGIDKAVALQIIAESFVPRGTGLTYDVNVLPMYGASLPVGTV